MVTNNSADFDTLPVTRGGTGIATTTTAYAVVCAGTTATAPLQVTASAGTAGQVLTSGGAGAVPLWASNSGIGTLAFISQTVSSGATATEFALAGYNNYYFIYYNVLAGTTANTFVFEVSDDAGATWKAASYNSQVIRWNPGGVGVQSDTTYIALTGLTSDYSSITGTANGNLWLNDVGTLTTTTVNQQGNYPSVAGPALTGICAMGEAPAALTINRVRFRMLAGTHDGTFNFYGVRTS